MSFSLFPLPSVWLLKSFLLFFFKFYGSIFSMFFLFYYIIVFFSHRLGRQFIKLNGKKKKKVQYCLVAHHLQLYQCQTKISFFVLMYITWLSRTWSCKPNSETAIWCQIIEEKVKFIWWKFYEIVESFQQMFVYFCNHKWIWIWIKLFRSHERHIIWNDLS